MNIRLLAVSIESSIGISSTRRQWTQSSKGKPSKVHIGINGNEIRPSAISWHYQRVPRIITNSQSCVISKGNRVCLKMGIYPPNWQYFHRENDDSPWDVRVFPQFSSTKPINSYEPSSLRSTLWQSNMAMGKSQLWNIFPFKCQSIVDFTLQSLSTGG